MPGLREQAEADLAFVLEDDVRGFGWPITVTDPDGNTGDLVGDSDDISQMFDPETGQMVSGRVATVILRISSLTAKGLGVPKGISDADIKPWIIEFDDINGNAGKFKVSSGSPDRTLGIVMCALELYE